MKSKKSTPVKEYCPNEETFEVRTEQDGRKMFRCDSCGRVLRKGRKHPLPSKSTRSYDATLGILWGAEKVDVEKTDVEKPAVKRPAKKAVNKRRKRKVTTIKKVAPKEACRDRFLVQALADPRADRRMECAKPKGHQGQHRNHTNDLTWSRGARIDLKEYA